MTDTTSPVGALTDGTGVSQMTPTKLAKDAVADFLLTLATVAGVGVGFDTFDLGPVVEAPTAFGLAIGSAFVRAVYRAVLRWATTD